MATELLDAIAVGERLGMVPESVLLLARRKRIPAVRISRRVVRFEWEEVVRALKGIGATAARGVKKKALARV